MIQSASLHSFLAESSIRISRPCPWVADPSFAGTLELYVRALATALMGLEYIAQVTAEKR